MLYVCDSDSSDCAVHVDVESQLCYSEAWITAATIHEERFIRIDKSLTVIYAVTRWQQR